MFQTTYPNTGARIMLFAGPATEGPGMGSSATSSRSLFNPTTV